MGGLICGRECWTPEPCPDHGDRMNPLGRSLPLGYPVCCDNYMKSGVNKRHLWDEHDDDRHYFDPEGWAFHEASCKACKPDEEECEYEDD